MRKKKKIIFAIAIITAITLSFVVGQRYSKYMARVRGDGMAEIATWRFKVNEQEEVQKINLISTCNNGTLVNNKIAPGTSGSFNILVDATGSEVGIDYKIQFVEKSEKPKNLKFTNNDIEFNEITQLESYLSGIIQADEDNKTKNLTIGWYWPYETGTNPEEIAQNDKIDTKNAQEIANYTFNILVSGTQVVPQT